MVDQISIVPASKVLEVLKYEDLIDTIESAFRKFSSRPESGVCQPARSVILVPPKNGYFGVMPGYSQQDEAIATKLITYFPLNKDVRTFHAVILVFDANTGLPKTIMDGELITTMRTAAASAVATKYLSAPNSTTLAILGAGTQARSHFHALASVRTFHNVRLWNWRRERADILAAEIGATVCTTVEEAVCDADVIVTVTSSPTPVLKKDWVKPGAHINAVGACRADRQELEPDLMLHSVVYADSYEGGYKESGDIILSKAEIYAELGEVILRKKEAHVDKTTVFKSLGLGIQDVVSAKLVMDKIEEQTA
ncbi:ketimine reductase mu-crystallin-like isoform X1 [Haliotis rufescens]|uniref:ketimine reductase mu-crystallin-like isoform X1 n=1 Tax=Haliotis rufescens TaxID=6454 RepID=UPI001EB04A68|nr:ketimine reductase mu-crystallin-like isoform X1 [Haliotis rufescens]